MARRAGRARVESEALAQSNVGKVDGCRVYLRLKDAKNAEDQFEAALLVDSNNTDGRLGLAEAQIEQSDFAGALPDLEAFTKSDAQNAAALRLLAKAYRGLGREDDAKRIEKQAQALGQK